MTSSQSSLNAYSALLNGEKRNTLLLSLYGFLKNTAPLMSTRNEISERTGVRLSSVCGRVAELLGSGMVVRGSIRFCGVTKEKCEVIGLPEYNIYI